MVIKEILWKSIFGFLLIQVSFVPAFADSTDKTSDVATKKNVTTVKDNVSTDKISDDYDHQQYDDLDRFDDDVLNDLEKLSSLSSEESRNKPEDGTTKRTVDNSAQTDDQQSLYDIIGLDESFERLFQDEIQNDLDNRTNFYLNKENDNDVDKEYGPFDESYYDERTKRSDDGNSGGKTYNEKVDPVNKENPSEYSRKIGDNDNATGNDRSRDSEIFSFDDIPNNQAYDSFNDVYGQTTDTPVKRSKQTSPADYLQRQQLPPFDDYPFAKQFYKDAEKQTPVYNSKSAFSEREEPPYNTNRQFASPFYRDAGRPVYNSKSAFSEREPVDFLNNNYSSSDYPRVDNDYNAFLRQPYAAPNFGYDNRRQSPNFGYPFASVQQPDDNFVENEIDRYFPLAKLLFPFRRGFNSSPTMSPFVIDPAAILRDAIADGRMIQTDVKRGENGPYDVTKITYKSDPIDRNFKGEAEFIVAKPKELVSSVVPPVNVNSPQPMKTTEPFKNTVPGTDRQNVSSYKGSRLR